jgi:hypothetical protein
MAVSLTGPPLSPPPISGSSGNATLTTVRLPRARVSPPPRGTAGCPHTTPFPTLYKGDARSPPLLFRPCGSPSPKLIITFAYMPVTLCPPPPTAKDHRKFEDFGAATAAPRLTIAMLVRRAPASTELKNGTELT